LKGNLLFLGTGSSAGVPMIGCNCSVCRSSCLKNKRLRSSCLVEVDNKILLLDVPVDFREQALKLNINHIDGLILTHAHYDHIGGLDDLRAYYLLENKPVSCLLSKETLSEVKKGFHYIFNPINKKSSISAQLDFQAFEKDFGETLFQKIKIKYLSYFQKETKVTGYIIGNLAYITDIKEFSDDIFTQLKGVDILILSALREESSSVHFNLKEAISFAEKVNAKHTYFTHIAHDLDHDKISEILPKNIYLAYDGLKIEFDYER
jgi:phosphoribosyl 1,2-cyclic phosphate phosphodiesterase